MAAQKGSGREKRQSEMEKQGHENFKLSREANPDAGHSQRANLEFRDQAEHRKKKGVCVRGLKL